MYLIVNPVAGGGAGRRALSRIRARLGSAGAGHRIVETTGRGSARSLAHDAAEAGEQAIVAVGGDGTVHEVANGMLDASNARSPSAPALGVLPVGTGNDFAKLIDGTGDPLRLYNAFESGAIRRFDAGRVRWDGGEHWVINAAGLGIDVEVVRQVEKGLKLPGFAGYLVGLLRALVRYRALAVTVRVDGSEDRLRVMMVAAANGRCVGGGFHLCPDARPDDGRFDVCIIRRLGPLGIARTLPRVLRGTHGKLSTVIMRRGTQVEIEIDEPKPLVFQLDGELHEAASTRRLRIDVLPGALPVIDPGAAVGAPSGVEAT